MNSDTSAGRDAYVAGRDQYLVVGQAIGEPQAHPIGTQGEEDYDRLRPIFAQYLNPEIRACYGKRYESRSAEKDLADALHATRLAALCTEGPIVIPASYLFEVPIMGRFLGSVEALRRAGCIHYVSYVPDLGSYVASKTREYRGDAANPYARRSRRSPADGLVWQPRMLSSAASDIAEDWRSAVVGHGTLTPAARSLAIRRDMRFEDAESMLLDVPVRLDGQAFIGRFVRAMIPAKLAPREAFQVDLFISRSYLKSYLLDLEAAILADLSFGDLSCGVGKVSGLESRVLSARQADAILRYIGVFGFIHHAANWADIISLRDSPGAGIVMRGIFDRSRPDLARRAALQARKRYAPTQEATTRAEASTRIDILAEEIIANRATYPT